MSAPTESLVQGSPEWLLARVGSLGASRVHDAIARTKTGYTAKRADILSDLVTERLTGKPVSVFVTQAMKDGTEREPYAREAYEFAHSPVVVTGLYRHPTIKGSHASPDGLVGDEGMIEIKCPIAKTHLETLLTQEIPAKYITQMQWQMECTSREWCDFVSWNPDFPPAMQLFVKRYERGQSLADEVAAMVAEVDAAVSTLRSKYEA